MYKTEKFHEWKTKGISDRFRLNETLMTLEVHKFNPKVHLFTHILIPGVGTHQVSQFSSHVITSIRGITQTRISREAVILTRMATSVDHFSAF